MLRVHIRSDSSGELLENMMRHAVQQLTEAAPGSDVIAARLAEVLFTEMLRRHVLQLPVRRTGWLAGAADPAVGRALACLHQRPEHAWTADGLARDVGLSRSVLTERFARYLGQAPMAYLTDWRLELAAEQLRTTSRSVLLIAGEVGYDSEAAFNRAFKRRFSEPPARYRRHWREQRRIGKMRTEEPAQNAA
ncbi:MAG: AraC family transcriptional regulator [Gammaproteobacteria bacterium]